MISVALAGLLLSACSTPPEPDAPAPEADAVEPAADPPAEPAEAAEADPAPPTEGTPDAEVARFVLPGYEVLDFASGDLNRDEFPTDVVLALHKTDEADDDLRPLLLLLRGPDGRLKFAARNDNVVMCKGCGGAFGDPWSGIVIKDGYFSAEHYGGSSARWTHIVTFGYDAEKPGWLLHKVGGDSFMVSDPDTVETTVKTVEDFGEVPFATYTGE